MLFRASERRQESHSQLVRQFGIVLLACVAVAVSGCGEQKKSAPVETSSPLAERVVTPEVQAVAEKALGSGAEVLTFGDLAHNGRLQVFAANRPEQGALGLASEIRVTRAVVLEKNSAAWNEVLRCDEYLKNPKGFLDGTPRAPVTGWQVRMDRQNEDSVRDFYFTPLQSGKAVSEAGVAVRWNPRAGRYQSHNRNGQFLGEIASLEIPGSELR